MLKFVQRENWRKVPRSAKKPLWVETRWFVYTVWYVISHSWVARCNDVSPLCFTGVSSTRFNRPYSVLSSRSLSVSLILYLVFSFHKKSDEASLPHAAGLSRNSAINRFCILATWNPRRIRLLLCYDWYCKILRGWPLWVSGLFLRKRYIRISHIPSCVYARNKQTQKPGPPLSSTLRHTPIISAVPRPASIDRPVYKCTSCTFLASPTVLRGSIYRPVNAG